MAKLSPIERAALYHVLEIKDGYILWNIYQKEGKTKSFTRDIIYDCIGLDIFVDASYKLLSQQKCIEKIIAECPDKSVAKVLSAFFDVYKMYSKQCEFYSHSCTLCKNNARCHQVQLIIEKLERTDDVTLPDVTSYDELKQDIQTQMENGKYSLAVDRLHTYSLRFLEEKCIKVGLVPNKDRNGHVMFDDMLTQLSNYYKAKSALSEFAEDAIKNSKILFQKYNSIRNNKSYSHPNEIILNGDARFVIETILAIINYIDTIDKMVR